MAESSSSAGSSCDLSMRLALFLDKHMMLRVVDFLKSTKVFSEQDLNKAEQDLLAKTCLFSRRLDSGASQIDVDMKKDGTQRLLQEYRAGCENLLAVLESQETMEELREAKSFNMDSLSRNYSVHADELGSLYHLARLTYDCGHYAKAMEYLDTYKTLAGAGERDQQVAWGKLAAHIMADETEGMLEAVSTLRDAIGAASFPTSLDAVENRVWMMHWGLFAFFGKNTNGRTAFIDLFFQDRNVDAASMRAPHLLRYATAALVLSKRKKFLDKLVKMLELEKYQHSDPVTRVLEKLYVHHDFDGALAELEASREVLANDFFLHSFADEFHNSALVLIFEAYCQVHQTIDTKFLAEKLNMEPADAELWIVNLIRSCHLDGKIDSETESVVLRRNYPSVYQQVFEKTKSLFFRSNLLSHNIDRAQQRMNQETQQQRRKHYR